MRLVARLLAVLACLGFVGCLGGDDQSGECPNGEEPRRTVYDLGENPRGTPSPESAVARFLRQERSDLAGADFEQADSDAHTASFTYIEGGSQLVRLYLERLDRGWLVIAYDFCPGLL